MIEIIDESEMKSERAKSERVRIHRERICCKCGGTTTYIYEGKEIWYNCHCGKKECIKDLCSICYSTIKNDRIDSHKNIRKSIADSRIGNQDVKGAILRINNWGSKIWEFNNRKKKDCDTYICIGYDKERKKIIAVYIVPNNEHIITLNKMAIPKETLRRESMYDRFKLSLSEIESYNMIYCNLISFIGNKKYFGIEDIKNWSKITV